MHLFTHVKKYGTELCPVIGFTLEEAMSRGTALLPFFLPSAPDGCGWSTQRPGRFIPGNDPLPVVWEAGWAPGQVWTGAEKTANCQTMLWALLAVQDILKLRGVQMMKLHTVQFSPVPCYFLLGPNIFLSALFANTSGYIMHLR